MKVFNVNSLPLKEVIEDLATQMNTDYFENCQQYYLKIPISFGEGTIKGINFESGLGIIQYQCFFREDVEIRFIVNKIHPLKFLFCAGGELMHRFEDQDQEHVIDELKSAIVASSDRNGHILRFKSNVETTINSLEIIREQFIHKITCELGDLSVNLRNLFEDKDAQKVFYYDGFYSITLAELFDQMENFHHGYLLRKFFLEGKSYEILTEQMLQYEDDLQQDGEKSLLRKSEMILVEKAADIIRKDIAEFDTVDHIAKKVGLNKQKLQKGFKSSYSMTVNNFVQKTRLELASSLLINTDLSISEISYKVGISSKSYLSKLFSDNYNITPKDFRKNNTRTDS